MALNHGNGGDRDETVQDAELARAYRAAAGEMPPPRLDDAIRAAARRAAGSGPRPLSAFAAWRLPLSLAAVVVLSVSVVLMMREEGVDPLALQEQSAPARKASPPAVPAETAPEPPAAAASRPRQEPRSAPPQPAASPAPAKIQAMPAPAVVADSPPLAAQETPVPGPAPVEARPAAAPRAMMRAAPPVSAPAAADRAAAPADAPGASRLWQDLVDAPPEHWIRRIGELRREGRSADADALLAEFRKRYPDWPPEALR